jgi:hypothetical protein
MTSNPRLVNTISLFAAALFFAVNASTARAGRLSFDSAGNLFAADGHSISKFTVAGAESTLATGLKSPVSLTFDSKDNLFVSDPDKQWEYRCDNDDSPEIVKVGTKEVVLNLSEVNEGTIRPTASAIVWAPDSKRFGFNYSPPHMHHTSWETIALYQLHGDKWMPLRSPVDQASGSTQLAQLAQLAKERLPKSNPDQDILSVRNWTDANTAILYDSSFRAGNGSKLNFLFTLKFDAAGNSKITKTHQISAPEVDESNQ